MMFFCCGSNDDPCKGISCKVDEAENGVTISLTADNPETLKCLKSMINCCKEKSDDQCCG